ncbi:DUF6089 family protein [Polaribacter sp.]|uniref:type IX secretion system protein PorG n=1 Tax=Polaribacter sp. TaxID=1920175 RepID=UPI003F6CA37E
MKNSILFIVFVSISSFLMGQVYEVGLSVGGTNFIGDIGRTNYIYPNKIAGNVFFKYNYNPRIALKATYSYLPISANDSNADTDLKQNRGFNFENTIHELAVGMDFNFYEYDVYSNDKNWTPYISIELAGFNYKTVQAEIQPGVYSFTDKTSYTIPFGVGFKSKLYGKFAFSLQTTFRYTFEDDLDYANTSIPALDIGGTGNDWYVFTGFSLIYTFGRPPCYREGL